MARELISIREVCDRYGLSDKTVRRKIKDGVLAAYRCGPRLIKLDAEEVEAALMRPVNEDHQTPCRDLAVDRLADHVGRVAAAWPPLTREQIDRIAAILAGSGDHVAAR